MAKRLVPAVFLILFFIPASVSADGIDYVDIPLYELVDTGFVLIGKIVKIRPGLNRIKMLVTESVPNEDNGFQLTELKYAPGKTYTLKFPKPKRSYPGEWVIYEEYPNLLYISQMEEGMEVIAVPVRDGRFKFIQVSTETVWKVRLMLQEDWGKNFIESLDDERLKFYLRDFDFFYLLYEEALRRGIITASLLAQTAQKMGKDTPLSHHYEQLAESSKAEFLEELVDYFTESPGNGSVEDKSFVLNSIPEAEFHKGFQIIYRLYWSEGEKPVAESRIKDTIIRNYIYLAQEEEFNQTEMEMLDEMLYDWTIRRDKSNRNLYTLKTYLDFAPLRCKLINRLLSGVGETTMAINGIDMELFKTISEYIKEHPSDCYDDAVYRQISESQNAQ